MGHYGFKVNKQALEIKEDNVSAYMLCKNSNIYACPNSQFFTSYYQKNIGAKPMFQTIYL